MQFAWFLFEVLGPVGRYRGCSTRGRRHELWPNFELRPRSEPTLAFPLLPFSAPTGWFPCRRRSPGLDSDAPQLRLQAVDQGQRRSFQTGIQPLESRDNPAFQIVFPFAFSLRPASVLGTEGFVGLVTNPAKSGPTLACDRCPNRLLGGASAGCAGIDLGCACLMSFVSNRGHLPLLAGVWNRATVAPRRRHHRRRHCRPPPTFAAQPGSWRRCFRGAGRWPF